MKKWRKLVSVFSCIMFLIVSLPTNSERVIALEDLIAMEDIDIEYVKKEAESTEQYRKMLESFNSNSKTRSANEQVYDENYGGSYIDENGELVVILVNTQETECNKIRSVTENNSIKIEKCQYSYNELMRVIDTIADNFDYLLEYDVGIAKMYEDVYTNSVQIGVHKLDAEKEAKIREIVDSPCMNIFNVDNLVEYQSSSEIKAGDTIVSALTRNGGTVGFCATRNGKEGIVTAGHLAYQDYEIMMFEDKFFGHVEVSSFRVGSNADAGFVVKECSKNSSYMIDVYACHYLAMSDYDVPVGKAIYKYGISTGMTNGTIKSTHGYTSGDINGDGIIDSYIEEQVVADYNAEEGDSGGPVFSTMGLYNGRITCKLLGIHSARDQDTNEAFFSKYFEIANELGIEAITF